MKIYHEQNVLDAAIERLTIAFTNFDNVYFSVSGGKDSSVMVQLANIVAKKINRKFDVLYIDLEAQYKATINHIEELKKLSQIRNFYWVSLPLALRNAVSQLQPKWICWDKDVQDFWVRDMPQESINIDNNPFLFFHKGMEFEEFIVEFAKWYQEKNSGSVACGVGIRSDESLNRWRTIASTKKDTFNNYQWTTLLKENNKRLDGIYNFYPLYDWRTEDIWGAVSKLDLKFNNIYEMMYKNGVSIHEQRLCQPYGDDQRNGLDQFRALEYETWEKILNRVNGVNFGNIYARTSLLGNLTSEKPDHLTWEQYTVFLLESIGLYNPDLKKHYIEKIKKFMKWYEEKEGFDLSAIPEEQDKKLESQKKVISWRRIAKAIERNDFYMKRLSFSQNKSDEEKLKKFITKYDNLLSIDTQTNDKHLNKFIERELKR